jgi:hypothetical protein
MPITYKLNDIPDLWTFDLPRDEQERAQDLQLQLREMASLTDEVASAVALFDSAQKRVQYLEELLQTSPTDRMSSPQRTEQEIVSGWQYIAARSVVMAAWQLDELQARATLAASAIPAVAALMDRKALKQSGVIFREYFEQHLPRPAAAMDGDDHAASSTPAIRGPAPPAPDALVILRTDLSGATLAYRRKGMLLQLDISQGTLARLVEVRDRFFAAFAKVGEALERQHWETTRQNAQQRFED